MSLRSCLRVNSVLECVTRRGLSNSASAKPPSAPIQPKPVDPLAKVTGLTTNCVLKPSGSAHSEEYKVPEYFLYGRHSFAEAEIELAQYRCPQPNANRK